MSAAPSGTEASEPPAAGAPGTGDRLRGVIDRSTGAQIALVLALAFAAWEALPRAGVLDIRLFSTPTRIVATFWDLLERGQIWPHVVTTLNELLLACALFTVVGGLFGVAAASTKKSFDIFYGPVATFFALPKITLAPIFVLVFGLGLTQRVLFGAMFGFFPLVMNTMVGVRGVRQLHVDLLDSVGAGPMFKLWRLYLPAILPQFLTGLRIGFVYAGIGVLLAEMFVAVRGLGNRITGAVNQATMDSFWVYVSLASILLLAGAGLVRLLEVRYGRWRVERS